MTAFTLTNGSWSETDSPPDDAPRLQVRADDEDAPPEVQFWTNGQAFFHLTGIEPRPQTDTTHTVALVNAESEAGCPIFAVHADNNDLVFEDCRSTSEPTASNEALDHARSSLNEILIPVYIDDVVSDFSEEVSGWVALHTVQYETDGSSWSYFRTSLFEDGTLLVEDEYGEI
jgi:hypothetical protein